jgi:putative ABC transport system permease protein
MIKNYLKIAIRTLALNKVYASINVIGLSIGLAAAMLILLYTKDEVSYDGFHAHNPNIYRITKESILPNGNLEFKTGITGYLPGPRFTAGAPEIETFVRFKEHRNDIKTGDRVVSQVVFQADPDFFKVFTFPLLSGDAQTALGQPNSVVLSEEMAVKQFGTTEALGKTLLLKDSYDEKSEFSPYQVTGVAKKVPQNSSIQFDVLMPLIEEKGDMEDESWFNSSLNTFVLINQKSSQSANGIKALETKINRIYQSEARDAIKMVAEKYNLVSKRNYLLQPFTEIHLSTELAAENGLMHASKPMFSYILSGIAVFILLIACINFVNLTVARSLKRAKEIGIRKVVGSGRYQLMLQFLGESFVLCFAAFVLAVFMVELVLPTFNQLSNKALELSYLFDIKLIVSYAGLFLVTGLLAGFYPAVILSGYDPVQTLYSRFNFSGKNYLQKSLVVVQFALASFLIMATLTIRSQFDYLTTKELGYDDKNLISIEKQNLTRPEAKRFTDELMKNPNIEAVVPKNGGRWGTGAKVNGDTEIQFEYETVGSDFLSVLKVPILKGRNFSPDLVTDSTESVIVNEAFVKKAGWKNPIGQIVDFWYADKLKYKVIGIVKDYHFAALSEEIKPQLLTMKPGNGFGRAFIKIKPKTETASLHHIEETFKRMFPFNPYSYKFIEAENVKRYEAEEKWKQIMLFGAVLTIFISAIGLFGLATLSAERRTKEIGIRKVLGASVASIVQLLSSDFLKLVALSFTFAFPAAYYAIGKWLSNYPYRIEISAWTFAATALLAIMITFFTVSLQSVKTALMNPVKSLRRE